MECLTEDLDLVRCTRASGDGQFFRKLFEIVVCVGGWLLVLGQLVWYQNKKCLLSVARKCVSHPETVRGCTLPPIVGSLNSETSGFRRSNVRTAVLTFGFLFLCYSKIFKDFHLEPSPSKIQMFFFKFIAKLVFRKATLLAYYACKKVLFLKFEV